MIDSLDIANQEEKRECPDKRKRADEHQGRFEITAFDEEPDNYRDDDGGQTGNEIERATNDSDEARRRQKRHENPGDRR